MYRSLPRPVIGDVTGALGDLGTVLPLAAGMILVAGIDPAAFFVTFGLASLLAGLAFRLPLPVQPQKAIAAAAIGQPWSPALVYGAGLGSGLIWLVLAGTPALRWLGRVVPSFIAQGVQLTLAATLGLEALRLLASDARLGAIALLLFVVSFWARLTALALTMLIAVLLTPAATYEMTWAPTLPSLHLPAVVDVTSGMLRGGFAQLPLTLAYAIFATVALSAVYFPQRPLTVGRLGMSTGFMNVGSALMGGVPLCYGAGGLAAQHLYGARTVWKNVFEAGVALTIGLFFAPAVRPALQGFPTPLLGGAPPPRRDRVARSSERSARLAELDRGRDDRGRAGHEYWCGIRRRSRTLLLSSGTRTTGVGAASYPSDACRGPTSDTSVRVS